MSEFLSRYGVLLLNGTLESLYIVFPITWVVTSAAVGISCTVVWKRISHSKQRFQN